MDNDNKKQKVIFVNNHQKLKTMVNSAHDHTYTTDYESFENAALVSMLNSGKSTEQISTEMYPHLPKKSAVATLNSVLSLDSHRKFGAQEIEHFCRVTGRFDTVFYLCDQLGVPRPVLNQKPVPLYVPPKKKRVR